MGIVVGSPVKGDDFFNREREIGDFTAAIDRAAHLLVTAPRRTGKTSLLLEVAQRMSDRYYCLFIDVQACTSEEDAVVKLALEAREIRGLSEVVTDAFRSALSTIIDRIDEVGITEIKLKLHEAVTKDWRAKGDELLARLAKADKPVALFFDELPILVNRILKGDDLRITPERRQHAHVFLSWLREATIRHAGVLRFVACGSIGLEPLLSQAAISETMTTFTPFYLPPWDRDTALAFLRDRAKRAGIEFRNDAEQRVLHLLGHYIPQHVQMFMSFIREQAQSSGSHTCGPRDVERIYRRRMLSVHGHVDLATYEDRLRRVVGPELVGAALELLTERAVVGRLTPKAAIHIVRSCVGAESDPVAELRFLLGLFTHDGYLKRVRNDYVFVSHLLRDWWKGRFSFGYMPVEKRMREQEN